MQVTETLQRVNLVINRTSAIDGVRQALAAEDYEGAARFVQRFYELADATAPESAPLQTPQAEEQEKVSTLLQFRHVMHSAAVQACKMPELQCLLLVLG